MAKTALDLIGEGETELHARAHSMANNHMESVKIWKGLIQINRNEPEIWRGLAKALYAAGDSTTAEKCSIKAKEIEAINANKSTELTSTNNPITTNFAAQPEEDTDPVSHEEMMSANQLLARPQPADPVQESVPKSKIDLAKAALEVQNNSLVQEEFRNPSSNSVANQDISWYNQGVALIEAGKYAEALSCFDRALPSFSNDDEMVIRILNGRGNAFYYLENYPACVESYHQAMLINRKKSGQNTVQYGHSIC